jgi:DUF1680 family protein
VDGSECGHKGGLLETARPLSRNRDVPAYLKTFQNLSDEQVQQVLAAEHGGLNEVFADLYADTRDPRYLALSRKFHHRAITRNTCRSTVSPAAAEQASRTM